LREFPSRVDPDTPPVFLLSFLRQPCHVTNGADNLFRDAERIAFFLVVTGLKSRVRPSEPDQILTKILDVLANRIL
jgi:hypothetical protein